VPPRGGELDFGAIGRGMKRFALRLRLRLRLDLSDCFFQRIPSDLNSDASTPDRIHALPF